MPNPSSDRSDSYPVTVQLSRSSGEGGEVVALAARLAEEMAQRWRRGERPCAEEFLALHPELGSHPAVVDLIHEEICLRQEYGEPIAAAEMLRRFPQWRAQLEVLLDCQRILEPADSRFPAAGEALGDFRLLAELGRGGLGCVFLATQLSLADRPVVLKLTPRTGREHLSLARLQHTHIVPLYSVQDDPERDLRLLCMPYFGSATLAHLLHALRDLPHGQRTGQHLLDVLDRAQAAAPVNLPVRGEGRQFLAGASYVQAICGIGACLADALQFAHERGLIHLDLKPSNVLLAADGQPMLLDFHLAREPIRPDGPPPEWLGGTLAYMSPEQKQALAVLREKRRAPTVVDGRSDLYSLGLVLYEALGGKIPVPAGTVPRLLPCHPHITVGLADLINHCLAQNPNDRYSHGAALAADLRRHLSDQPLQGVPNRSWSERWHKLKRRRPLILAQIRMTLAVLIAVAAVGISILAHFYQRLGDVRVALTAGKDQLQKGQYTEAVATLQRGLSRIENIPGYGDLTEAFANQLRQAEQAQAADKRRRVAEELHRLADRIRFLSVDDSLSPQSMRLLEASCRTFWDERDRIMERLGPKLGPDVRTDLLDVAILWTDLHVRLASEKEANSARQKALQVLDQAEALFGPSPILDHERQAHAKALRLPAARRSELAPRTAWEHYALGQALLRTGKLKEAAQELAVAIDLQPEGQRLWPYFYHGVCAYRLERYEEAVTDFTACTLLAPQNAGAFYNLGLAYQALKETKRALRNYDHALQIDDKLAAAALNRGILHQREKRYDLAIKDLEQALQNGANPATVHFNQALVHQDQENLPAARKHVKLALEHNPKHEGARRLRESLQRR